MTAGAEHGFGIEIDEGGAKITIRLSGEIDGQAAAALKQSFERVRGEQTRALVLDLGAVSFIDSAGLRALIEIERALETSGTALEMRSPNPDVIDLLRTIGLSQRVGLGPVREPASGFTEWIEMDLPKTLRAAARARAAIREALTGLSPDELAATTLLTSEIVTNAVVHTAGAEPNCIRLLIGTAPERVGVQVHDPGPGFDPQRPPPRPPEQGGRGLLLVDHLASRWGAAPAPGRSGWFCVWFELDLGTLSLAEAAPGP